MRVTDGMSGNIPSQLPSMKDEQIISVLLIEEQSTRCSALKKALVDFNYHVTKHLTFDDSIITQLELCNPNVLILAADLPSQRMLKELSEVSQLLPLPIIIFAENDSPNVIQSAIKAGVSAYVVHEILPQRIKSIISVANERFKEVQALRNELKQTKTQLESRKLIERAKGYIMQQKQVSENEAYSTLRKMAMDQGSPIAMVAKNIIDVCELLSTSKV
ncbi:ANTAR domain-containing response regulator [Thalassotalea atypica]|uniref:ANTAR domain-containing response regulator n=1 Tax=Thalassotalea atypica TaxID=2054316 RepID=UPI002573DDB4|nr:ANTAR domain-containing protein [Thalassotalea atypica]